MSSSHQYTPPILAIPADDLRQIAETPGGEALLRHLLQWSREIETALSGSHDNSRRVISEQIKTVKNYVVQQVAAKALTDSLPVTPATFVGPYTDDFNTTDFLTGPFTYGGSGAAFSADGYLSLSVAAGGSPEWVYAGRAGGAFLPKNSDWTVIAKVTQCDTVYNKAGLGIAPQAFADGIDFGASGKASITVYRQTSSITRIYTTDSVSNYVDVTQLPTRSVPLYLKVAWDASAGTLAYSYRFGDTGSFTAIATSTVGTGYWSDKCDVGPLGGSTGTTNIDVELDSIEVSYTPEGSVSDYAFIPTAAFSGYKKGYVYVQQDDGSYKEIEPQSWMVVMAYGSFWRYDGSDWVLFDPRWTPATHGIDDSDAHDGVSGAVEDNIVTIDANGLPQDGGEKITDQLKRDGTRAMTGALDMGSNPISNVSDPTNAQDAATKNYVDTVDATKADKVSGATAGNFASLDANGNLQDSGHKDADYADATHATQHENGGADEINVAGLSGVLADAQVPQAHAIGGSKHTASTLAELNALVSDATLDDSGDARTPTAHASTHYNAGSDAIPEATTSVNGLMSAADKTKLGGIEAGAEANDVSLVASGDNVSITSYVSIAGLERNKHYRLYWSGWLDNGGNTVDNKFYLRFDGDSTAGNYSGYRYAQGAAAISDTSADDAIEFARTAYYKDTYFQFVIDIFTGDESSYFAIASIKVHGTTYDNQTDNRTYLWDSGGTYKENAVGSTPSIQFGIKTTGTGYTAHSWYRLMKVA